MPCGPLCHPYNLKLKSSLAISALRSPRLAPVCLQSPRDDRPLSAPGQTVIATPVRNFISAQTWRSTHGHRHSREGGNPRSAGSERHGPPPTRGRQRIDESGNHRHGIPAPDMAVFELRRSSDGRGQPTNPEYHFQYAEGQGSEWSEFGHGGILFGAVLCKFRGRFRWDGCNMSKECK